MRIRKAESGDAKAIAEVHVASWRYAYKGIMPSDILENLSVSDREAAWESIAGNGEWPVFVSELDNQITGFVHTCQYRESDIENPIPGEITALYLSPQAIGHGVGAKLMTTGLDHLRKGGYSNVALWVLEANLLAIGFYQKFGFTADGACKLHSRSGLSEIRYVL